MVTSVKQDTPSINEQLRLMTPTQISSISLSIPKLVLQLDTTLLNSITSGMCPVTFVTLTVFRVRIMY